MNALNSPPPLNQSNRLIPQHSEDLVAHRETHYACPGCFLRNSQLISGVRDVPVNCSALWPSRAEARHCTTGPVELRGCTYCGLVFNALFDAKRMVYDTQYDNSLDFSSAFQNYVDSLSSRLVNTYQLRRKRLVEIGCGSGTFLKALCHKGNSTGIGYDPSFTGDSSPVSGVRFSNGYFDPPEAKLGFDFLSCRHVLEHLPSPLEFLLHLSKICAESPDATFYFEVPNGSFVLGGDGLWDVIYPHVSYFTEKSLRNLFERAGFEVLQAGRSFSDQFLFIEARHASAPRNGRTSHPDQSRSGGLGKEVTSFAAHFERAVGDWSDCLERLAASGKPYAFWGAGAKGVTFLNLVPGARDIPSVIDSNTRKQQMFVPGTGQRVIGPDALPEVAPSAIIVLNAAYRQEIGSLLASQGIRARLISEPGAALL
jgi:SAM-dependent methyltransferase